jgi:hypothetical protein
VIQLHETNPDFYRNFGESRANMMGLVDKRGALDFYHGGLRARDADGGPIFDHVELGEGLSAEASDRLEAAWVFLQALMEKRGVEVWRRAAQADGVGHV